jgi:uncharacterized RDD family membrane protein YckC
MSRFCEQCGTDLAADAVFCEECGALVETTATVAWAPGIERSPRRTRPATAVAPTRLMEERQFQSARRDLPVGPSTWLRRAAASLIEALISVVVTYGPIVLVLGSGAFDALGIALLFMFLAPLAFGVLNIALLLRRGDRNGQSLGKQIAGVRIVRENGQRFSFGPLVGRGLANFICLFILPIDLLWPLWDRNDQTLHDKLAHTRVLRLEDAPAFIAAARGEPLHSAAYPSSADGTRPQYYEEEFGSYYGERGSAWPGIAAAVAVAAFLGGGAAILMTRHNELQRPTYHSSGFIPSDSGTHPSRTPVVNHGPAPTGSHDEWPDDTDAYTIFLAARTTYDEAQEVVQEAAARGVDAHVLESSRYPRLKSGYYVVYSGVYGRPADASAHLSEAKSVHSDAYVKWVSPAGNDAPKAQPAKTAPPRRRPGPPGPFTAEYTQAEKGSFTIDVPVGWEVTDDPGEDPDYVETTWSSAKDSSTNVAVGVTPDSTTSPLETAEQARDELSTDAAYEEVLWRSTTANDVPAWKWIYKSGDTEHVNYFINACGTGYRVTATASAYRFRAYEGIFSHIADSLEAQC